MQVQDRMVLSAGIPSSTTAMNSNSKDVISPNPSMSSNPNAHMRSNSSNSMPQDHLSSSLPLVRSRTAPQGQQLHLRPKPEGSAPQIERSNSDSANDNANNIHNNNDWNWPQSTPSSPSPQSPRFTLEPSDPDSQEQALFEERLCEDIYGVAVRKINQNGKSNLRYVKCVYMDAPDALNTDDDSMTKQNYSSNRSVSSRHSRSSRVSLPRFLSKGSNHHHHHRISMNTSLDQDDQRSLLESDTNSITNNKTSLNQRNSKVRVLSWGKKKDVTVPLSMFTAVRKGKVNDRTRRNPCDSSRILSLVTSDIHSTNEKHHNSCVSLDIEAPTRLDRDKFAKAFARFLNVPLIEEDEIIRAGHPPAIPYVSTAFPQQQYNHRPPPHYHASTDGNRSIARSIRSETTAQSWRDSQRQSIASSVNSIPDVALTASNSLTTNEKGARSSSWKQLKAPLPVVTMKGINGPPSSKNISKPPLNNRRSISGSSSGGVAAPAIHPGISGNASNSKGLVSHISVHSTGSRTGSDADDPPLGSLPSSTHSRGASINKTNSMGVNNNITNNNRKAVTSSPNAGRRMVLDIPFSTKSKLANKNNSSSNHDRSTPATSAISAQVHSHSTPPQIPATEPNTANNVSRDTTTGATDEMDASVVSSITGVGFDQDLVEELHVALERMKVELEESRAEAARAVKVAEQAIQSAENSSSKDWNNTVTHKAAEAAATAQKKSAEAMAKARIAEERLAVERKASALRKKQVKDAEQLAAHWQTRAAAAEVQRFAVAEALESERKKNADLLAKAESSIVSSNNSSPQRFDPFEKIKPSSPLGSRIASELAEVDRLRSKLAMESARRRKLLDELQDLRGSIRVYCRLKAPSSTANKKLAFMEMVSNEVLMLHRDRASSSQPQKDASSSTPLCYEFDGIMASDVSQQDVYAEVEAICASVVEGFRICVMSYGQANAGKTHTMLGDVVQSSKNHSVLIENEGIHLRATKQLFSLLEHSRGQFEHTVTMNLVEVHNEKLTDLLAGTDFGEENGKVEARKSSRRTADEAKNSPKRNSELKPKLEIKTNRDGETVVRGVLSVDLASFEDVVRVWSESLAKRSRRLSEQKVEDPVAYEKESHIVATLKVTSKNLSTGSIANGKMQFVDFASSDITSKRPLGSSGGASSLLSQSLSTKLLSSGVSSEQLLEDWKFTNKSLNIVREVVLSRSQYQRSVPYRNSTITHLLSDSFEADTKVVLIACVSSDEKDAQNTACTLQLAQEMRKVIVGKATRHTTIASEIQKS